MALQTWLRKKINSIWWISKWENQQTSFHRNYPAPDLIHYFEYLNLPRGAHILVPLCGKSKDLQWLADNGYSVTGIELSPLACEEFFAEINVTPTVTQRKHFRSYQYQNIELLCGDFFKLKKSDLPPIDAIYDCRAFVALSPELRHDYIQQLLSCSSNVIKILLIGFSSASSIKGPPFSVTAQELEDLFDSNLKVQILKHELSANPPQHLLARGFKDIFDSVYLIY